MLKTCKPLPLMHSSFLYWCKYHHTKNAMSLECHYMTSDVITWCPNDGMLSLTGMFVHAPGRYAEQISSRRAVTPRWTLSFSFRRARNCGPRRIPWHIYQKLTSYGQNSQMSAKTERLIRSKVLPSHIHGRQSDKKKSRRLHIARHDI